MSLRAVHDQNMCFTEISDFLNTTFPASQAFVNGLKIRSDPLGQKALRQ